MPEFSPLVDFEEGSCGQFYSGTCRRGGNCNFLHIKNINKDLLRALYVKMYKDHPEYYEKYRQKKEQRKQSKK